MNGVWPAAKNRPKRSGARPDFIFLPLGNGEKVGMQCTVFWWIMGLADAKSLIVDMYCITKCLLKSTKCGDSSTKCGDSSTRSFRRFCPSFSLFLLIIKEKENIKASTKEQEASTKVNRCLFFNPPVVLRFLRNWWIVVDSKRFVFNGLRCYPPISTNPPVFSLYPPFSRFS
jgi:hypothetical protein